MLLINAEDDPLVVNDVHDIPRCYSRELNRTVVWFRIYPSVTGKRSEQARLGVAGQLSTTLAQGNPLIVFPKGTKRKFTGFSILVGDNRFVILVIIVCRM